MPTVTAASSVDHRIRMKGVISACAGNMVEWYDFFVYAYAAIYFASSFFPAGDKTSQLLSAAAVFAVGFLMRPLGGWIFGRMADRRGRKTAMVISVYMMCGGSLLVAVLPTYEVVGVAAPVLLVFARMLQGLAVGAEYGTGAAYISEFATPGRRGFIGSFQYVTIVAGQLLALLTVGVLQLVLSNDQLIAWGWRIPFFIGAANAIVVIYLRRSMVESATESDMKRKDAGSIAKLAQHKRALAFVLVLTMCGSLFYYTFATYMQKFLVLSVGLSPEIVSFIMIGCLVCFMCCQPIFGALSDRFGTKPLLLVFSGLGAVMVIPLFSILRTTTNPYVVFALVLSGLLVVCCYSSISGLIKSHMFPPAVRALGVGLPYAVANAAFGGTAEYVALSLMAANVEHFFYYYLAIVAGITFGAVCLMPSLETHGYLDGTGTFEQSAGLPRKHRSPRLNPRSKSAVDHP